MCNNPFFDAGFTLATLMMIYIDAGNIQVLI